ncbi:MAG TPA: hypothetical protein VFA42_01025 [Gaiellaceae bacterium]|jgi:hypothetical protein|nr:hypothetical protein [Gaiellaceae bacterium]
MAWRSALLLAYVGLGILFGVVLGGGSGVLVFFAVWGGVWLGFSLFWGWADRARNALLKRSTRC